MKWIISKKKKRKNQPNTKEDCNGENEGQRGYKKHKMYKNQTAEWLKQVLPYQ